MLPFDEVRFPLLGLPGFSSAPEFQCVVLSLRSGVEFRIANRGNPTHTFNVSPLIRSEQDLQDVMGFFIARNGSSRAFRFRDWHDYSTDPDDVRYGYVDGDTLGRGIIKNEEGQLRLYKRYTDSGSYTYDRRIFKPDLSDFRLYSGGTLVPDTDYSVSDMGIVTTGQGGNLSWVGTFDIPVRFSPDNDKNQTISWDAFQRGSMSIRLDEILLMDLDEPVLADDVPLYPTQQGGGGGPGGGPPGSPSSGSPAPGGGGDGGGGGSSPEFGDPPTSMPAGYYCVTEWAYNYPEDPGGSGVPGSPVPGHWEEEGSVFAYGCVYVADPASYPIVTVDPYQGVITVGHKLIIGAACGSSDECSPGADPGPPTEIPKYGDF